MRQRVTREVSSDDHQDGIRASRQVRGTKENVAGVTYADRGCKKDALAWSPRGPRPQCRCEELGLGATMDWDLGMQIRSEFNLNSPNSLRIRSQREFAANLAGNS